MTMFIILTYIYNNSVFRFIVITFGVDLPPHILPFDQRMICFHCSYYSRIVRLNYIWLGPPGLFGLRRNFVNLYALREECASLPISYEAPLKPNELKSYNYTPLFSYWLTTDIVLMCGRE